MREMLDRPLGKGPWSREALPGGRPDPGIVCLPPACNVWAYQGEAGGCVCGAQVVEYVAVCGVLHCHGSNARALGLGDVVRSLAMGPLRALS